MINADILLRVNSEESVKYKVNTDFDIKYVASKFPSPYKRTEHGISMKAIYHKMICSMFWVKNPKRLTPPEHLDLLLMQFDVVITNPPFQDSTQQEENTTQMGLSSHKNDSVSLKLGVLLQVSPMFLITIQ